MKFCKCFQFDDKILISHNLGPSVKTNNKNNDRYYLELKCTLLYFEQKFLTKENIEKHWKTLIKLKNIRLK